MKKISSLLLLLVIAATQLIAQSAATLSGTIKGLPDNTKLYFYSIHGNKMVPADSINMPGNGAYAFRVAINEPAFMVMRTSLENAQDIHVMLMPGENVTLNMRYTPMYNHTRITKTAGSRNMELYRRFNNLIPAGQDQVSQWNLKTNVAELVEEYSDCLMSAFVATFFEEDFADYGYLYKTVYDKLGDKYPANTFVQHLKSKLSSSIVAGMPAPDIAMKDPAGKLRKLSDMRGKVVLLDFWASWCGPCRRENPNVVALYKRYNASGFDVYSVSLDKDKSAWTKAIADDGLLWQNHVSDLTGWSSSGGKIYGISSVPSTVLIDANGIIIARNLRGAELENKLKEIFGF